MRLGVIGLGNIGSAIARNLVADGHDVSVFDVERRRIAEVPGARSAESALDVGERAEVTFTSLPTPEIVDEVAEEWARGAEKESVLVDLSTSSPESIVRLGRRLAGRLLHLVEAPLTGGAVGAEARQLVFIVGGDPEVIAPVQPILDRLGRATFHLGGLGTGNAGKLVNSLLAFAASWVSLEGLAIAGKSGIDLRAMIDLLNTSGVGNLFTERIVEGLASRGKPAQFSLELAAKDAGLLLDHARRVGVPAPAAAAIAQSLVAAVGAELGERDFTEWVELIERQAGTEIRVRPKTAE